MSRKKFSYLAIALIISIIGAIVLLSYLNRFLEEKGKRISGPVQMSPEAGILKEEILQIVSAMENMGYLKVISREGELSIEPHTKDFKGRLKDRVNEKNPEIETVFEDNSVTFRKKGAVFSLSIVAASLKAIPLLAIVIDDIGNSKEYGEEVLKLKGVTISIIPELKYSLYFAEKGKELGKEILIHVPMEPKNPGKYSSDTEMLKVDMNKDEILKLTERFLNSVPYATGANNHMGSKFTEDEHKMKIFLGALKKKKLFFLDSRTSSDSKGFDTANGVGVKSLKRNVFLDHDISEEKISEQLDKAVDEAQKNGFAIAVGHPHKETINVLKKRLNEIRGKVEVVSLSRLNSGK